MQDKKGNIIKEGDIVFYSESSDKDDYHYADSICEIIQHEGKLSIVSKVFTPGCGDDIGGHYKEIDDEPPVSLEFCSKDDMLIIGNLKKNSDMLTVKYAESRFPLDGKYMGERPERNKRIKT